MDSEVKRFRNLSVWQVAMDPVEEVYRLTQGFSEHERYNLAGQTRRAAVSMASNIAEGHTRSHTKGFLHHLSGV